MLGRIEREDAFRQAIEANLWLASQLDKPRLVDRLTGNHERSVGKWAERYDADLLARNPPLAANTLKTYGSMSRRTVAALGADTPMRAITPLRIAEELDKLAGQPRTAQAWRSFMRDYFRAAIVQGWIDQNPVRDVRGNRVEVKRARLTLEVYQQWRAACDIVWLRNAGDLALVSAQRREDIALAEVPAFRDRAWRCEQRKTGSKVEIPFDLRLDAIGMSLGDVYEQCRRTGVLSKYLIHQTEDFGNSPKGRPIWKDTISRRFTDVLETLRLDWGDRTPPTFHEIRSLAERLYSAQGGVDTQQLLGHSDPDSTQLYHNARGSEWTRVRLASSTE